ncbi:MAG: hypothetical protein IRY99_21445, partial [Isosphaeraceae bacterium]|nr:hypothetical protein [Isosphaeraceae bacterium]
MSPLEPSRPRRQRRWRLVRVTLAFLVLTAIIAVAALPWALNTQRARVWLLARANRVLAPGKLEVASFRFSWFGPTEMTGFAIRDPQGDRVVAAPRALWDRDLGRILFDRPRYGTLTLEGATLDVERLPDGSIDLYEALRPILTGTPATDLTILIARGTLRLRGSGLARPVSADAADLAIRRPPAPRPVSWRLKLAQTDGAMLDVQGRYDRWRTKDLDVHLSGKRWPLAVAITGLNASGRFDGRAEVAHRSGRWELSGEAKLLEPEAAGPRLRDQRLGLEQLTGIWDVAVVEGSWAVRRLDLDLAGDAGAASRALAAWTGIGPLASAGRWSARVQARDDGEGLRFQGQAEARDIPEADGPITLDFHGAYRAEEDRCDLDRLTLAAKEATLTASGRVEDLRGRRRLDLSGTLTPDWEVINTRLADRIEPDARVLGKPGRFALQGNLADGARMLTAEVGFELDGADVYGLRLGPTAIIAHHQQGDWIIDPIRSTLNGGRLALDPELIHEDEGRLILRLASGSAIEDAEVNDEVSHRVLSFVAPVLEEATRVRGRVSVKIDRAEFPLAEDAGRRAVVEGLVVFRDVAFAPGPLAADLLDLLGRGDATLKLDEPVVLSVADGRVYQRDLEVPVGRLARIGLEGWVDFDRNLHLTASVPLLPEMLRDRPVLSVLFEGQRIAVPIRGTLSHPRVDRDAFRASLRALGEDLLTRGAVRGAAELLQRLARPRDPAAAPSRPRLMPEERRQR